MKNVLLIGDSIRLGYQGYVSGILGDKVRIFAPDENCRFTKFALWGMFSWMESFGNPRIDAAHWNTGAWDLHRATADGKNFSSVEEYVRDCERLCIQMESYTDKLIWANMIPGNSNLDKSYATNALINSNESFPKVLLTDKMDKWNSDVKRYNEAAEAMHRARGIRINDLYSVISEDPEKYISEDGVHPTDEGYRLLAEKTAAEIEAVL